MPDIDLTQEKIPPGQQLVARDKWPIIGEHKPANSTQPWQLTFSGLVKNSITFTAQDLQALPQTSIHMDIHCVTRWSRQKMTFTGVLLSDLLEKAIPDSSAAYLSFISRSERKHSTSLPLQTAMELQTLIANQVDGQPLHLDHGGPIRNIVPGRYFYKSVKWLEEIELLSEDRLGFWEAETGYHNNADYWLEERYMAPTIDRRTAIKLIESRDFSGKDLRSIDASKRDLGGLKAVESLLRDADFRKSNLENADFTDANLSNAHLENSDLRGVIFTRTDLEGANLSGADLRGAQFDGCSLIGSSFCETRQDGSIAGAKFDGSTQIDESLLQPLTSEQIEYVKSQLKNT